MKKSIIILFTALLVFIPVYAVKNPVNIQGKIKGLSGGNVVLLDADRTTELARVKGLKDSFKMNVNVEAGDGRFYYIKVSLIGKNAVKLRNPIVPFFIDSRRLALEAQIIGSDLKLESVLPSPTLDEYFQLIKQNSYSGILSIAENNYLESIRLCDISPNNPKNQEMLHDSFYYVNQARTNLYNDYVHMIPTHPTSDALLAIICTGLKSTSIDDKVALISLFDKSMQDKFYGKQMMDAIHQAKASEVGMSAPDFTLKDVNGNDVKLSSLRGHYVLLDFWASWCGPCKSEFPSLKNIYADYKDKNLIVVGVSIDTNQSDWLNAIQSNGLDYMQLLDSERKTIELYNYRGIPYLILVSPQGVILERGLRGEQISKKILERVL
jgi:peroxiredoxin